MRYGIFSDVHGNLEAFQAVLEAYKKENIDTYLCAGDSVGYGANPGECLHLIRELKAQSVAGNHDWAVAGKLDCHYFNRAAQEAVFWTQHQISPEDRNFLSNLDLVYSHDDLILVHGTLYEPACFHYLVEREQADRIFHLMDRNICFIGHTHVPLVLVQDGEGRNILPDSKPSASGGRSKIELDSRPRYIVNVGSVGQPRDGNPLAAYCIYDSDARTFEIHRIAYDIETAQRKILEAGLPEFLAYRLRMGQ